MGKIKVLCVVLFLLVLTQPVWARESMVDLQSRLKEHMNEIRMAVRRSDDPVQKRALLSTTLKQIIGTMRMVAKLKSLSDEDRSAVVSLQESFQDKYDELNGLNGFEKVADEDLNDFADWVLQDLEQARKTITIPLAVAIGAIVLLVILLVA